MFDRFIRKLRYWLNPAARENSLQEEMKFHLEMKMEELMQSGMTEIEARNVARKQFGNLTLHQEKVRGIWMTRWMDDFMQDIRYAFRSIRHQPGFALVAILSASLGIGACSLIFALANFALFRSLPVEDPHHLVSITGKNLKSGKAGTPLTFPDFEDIRKTESLTDAAAVISMVPSGMTTAGEPRQYWGSIVTANYFDVVRPEFILGRGFDQTHDNRLGEKSIIVLSYQLWKSRYSGDRNILGKDILLNGQKATVIGVTGPEFKGEDPIFFTQFWVPFSMMDSFPSLGKTSDRLLNRNFQWLSAVGRIRPEANAGIASAEMNALALNLETAYPDSNQDRSFIVEPAGQAHPGIRHLMKLFFLLLLTASILILIAACTNIANLLLARGSSRKREIATRLSIGAGRERIIRQLLTESILIALIGGIAGYGIALAGVKAISRLQIPLPLPIDLNISVDYRVTLFCICISTVTGIIFGILPALKVTQFNLTNALKDDHWWGRSIQNFSLRNALVLIQVSICTLLLICSGLFIRSFYQAGKIYPGFSHRNVLLATFDLNSVDQTGNIFRDILQKIDQIPGVRSSALANTVPLKPYGMINSAVGKEGGTGEESGIVSAKIISITPNFFKTLGIHMMHGQDFQSIPSSEKMALINQSLSKRLFSDHDPVGHRIRYEGQSYSIQGVVENTKTNTLGEDPSPALYLPLTQENRAFMGITLLVHTKDDPAAYSSSIRQIITDAHPHATISEIKTMEMHLTQAMMIPRTAVYFFGIAGLMGLIIASVGIYGLVSFTVVQRTKDIGIRMALGATRAQVMQGILSQGFVLTIAGSLIGMGMAFGATRLASSLLYGISPTDTLTFVLVPIFLFLISLMACFIPSMRAASIDPATTLKYE